ncbi:MAG TPA: hypothetical protein PLZ55_16675 [bacterium]|nr:hypothetical protein [bacterium]HPO10310.1 hypothetical protein [bacterium]HQP98721.1 hypothetical protein [bacterium]
MQKKKEHSLDPLPFDAIEALKAARGAPSPGDAAGPGKPAEIPSVPVAQELQVPDLPEIAHPPETPSIEVPAQVSVQGTRPGVTPRIIREGLVDAMITWIEDYFKKLERAKAPKVMLIQVAQAYAAIGALRKDLQSLERSIELVGRDNAATLIDHAGEIRSQIIAMYEKVASDS